MGGDPEREPPFFFSKPADSILPLGGHVLYPPATRDLHHEVELVVAIGGAGTRLDPVRARTLIFGYAVGLDLTRRDLQAEAKARSRPWDMAKGFDGAAPCSEIAPAEDIGHPDTGRIELDVNGTVRQQGDLAGQIWSPVEVLVHLSALVTLEAGDLVFTGTPAGVGPLEPGDVYRAWIDGVGLIEGTVGAPATG